MRIYSGNCCMCDVGIATEEKDIHGNDLFSGDIVQLWHGTFLGTDSEEWMPSSGLTAIVADQYQSYSGETVKIKNKNPIPFTMGIAAVGVQNEEWKVSLVKSHKHIIIGERFQAYGFNYRK